MKILIEKKEKGVRPFRWERNLYEVVGGGGISDEGRDDEGKEMPMTLLTKRRWIKTRQDKTG